MRRLTRRLILSGFSLGLLLSSAASLEATSLLRPTIEGKIEEGLRAGLEEPPLRGTSPDESFKEAPPSEELVRRVLEEELRMAAQSVEEAMARLEGLQDREAFLRSQSDSFRNAPAPELKGPRARWLMVNFHDAADHLAEVADAILLDEVVPFLEEARQEHERRLRLYERLGGAASSKGLKIPPVRSLRSPNPQPPHDPRLIPEGDMDISFLKAPLRAPGGVSGAASDSRSRAREVSSSVRPTPEEIEWLAQAIGVEVAAVERFMAQEEERRTKKRRGTGKLKRERKGGIDLGKFIVQKLRPYGKAGFQIFGALDRLPREISSEGISLDAGPLARLIQEYEKLKESVLYGSVLYHLKVFPEHPVFQWGLRYALFLGTSPDAGPALSAMEKRQRSLGGPSLYWDEILAFVTRWYQAQVQAELLSNPRVTSLEARMARQVDWELPFRSTGPGPIEVQHGLESRSPQERKLYLDRYFGGKDPSAARREEVVRSVRESLQLSEEERHRRQREERREYTYARHLVEEFPAEIALRFYWRKEEHDRLISFARWNRVREAVHALTKADPEGLGRIRSEDVSLLGDVLENPAAPGLLPWEDIFPQPIFSLSRPALSGWIKENLLAGLLPGLGLLRDRSDLQEEISGLVSRNRAPIAALPAQRLQPGDPLRQAGLFRLARAHPGLMDCRGLARPWMAAPSTTQEWADLFGSSWDGWSEPEAMARRAAFLYLVSMRDRVAVERLLEGLERYFGEKERIALLNPHTLPLLLEVADAAKGLDAELFDRALAALVRWEFLHRLRTVKNWMAQENHERLVEILSRLGKLEASHQERIFLSASPDREAVLPILKANLRPQARRLLERVLPQAALPSHLAYRPLAELVQLLIPLAPAVSGRILIDVALLDHAKARVAQARLHYFRRKLEAGVVQNYQGELVPNDFVLLGVAKEAFDEDLLRRNYRALARAFHPDIFPDDAQAMEEFPLISSAHRILSSPEKRSTYVRSVRWETAREWSEDVAGALELPGPGGPLALPSGEENIGLEERAFLEKAFATGA